jgi:WD40 repeat protein
MIFSLNRSLRITALLFLTAVSGLTQKPELVVQTGHSASVLSVAFSPAGDILASCGRDHTVKLWEVSTGTELRTLKGHSDSVRSVAFSSDGKVLASGSDDKTIKLWEISTGRELRTLNGHSGIVVSVAFSRDGKLLASGSWDHMVKLWDIATGTELRSLIGHTRWVHSVAFSPDGKTLASSSEDYTVRLWDVATGTELRTLNWNSHRVESIAFNPDGKMLAAGSVDKGIKLWDVSTGAELRTLTEPDEVSSVAFNPDGTTLASGGVLDNAVKLWDVSTGAELRTLKGHSYPVNFVAFSSDGTLASASVDKTIKLWEVRTGTELRTLKGQSDLVSSVAFRSDRKILASGSWDNTVSLWDLATGAELRTLKGHSWLVTSVTFSPDRKTLASGSWDHTIKLWDVATGTELRTLNGHSHWVLSVAFSLDGKTLASGSEDETVKLWDVATGTELGNLKGHSKCNSVAFSPDGKTLACGSWDYEVKLWEVATGTESRTLKAYSDGVLSVGVFSVAFGPDGRTLASGSDDGIVRLWDVSTGTELRTLRGHSAAVQSVAFSPDGKILASGGDDSSVKLWDVSTGAELNALRGHSYSVNTVAFSPDNKYLVSGSSDTSMKVWEVASGKELASLIALGEHDWIVVTPDGLFDGSPAAWNKIIWRFNNNTFEHAPVEAFFNEFYYPGLLTDIFAGKRPKAPSDIAQKDRRQATLKLAVEPDYSPPQTKAMPTPSQKSDELVSASDLKEMWEKILARFSSRTIKVKISVTNAPAGTQDLRLFRNGSLVKVWHGDLLKGQGSVTLEATIPIIAGENRLTVYAFNRDNIKSSDANLTITGTDSLKRKGVAYVLAVGVNEYANSQYNLKYAVADAQDFAEQLKLQQAKLNNYERVEVISLNDRDATKANILKALADLAAKVQPEDALIIYFAGHGTAQQNRFYLIPHDLGYDGPRTALTPAGLKSILSHSISDLELEQAVEGIDAGQMLMVIDACNSGQALEAEEKRRGPMNSKGLAQLAYEKGMYILTAAQSYQAAQEAAKLGHGYLTYALVEEGLKTSAADREPKDGQVLLREWLNFATKRVPEMQLEKVAEQKKQGRQLEQIIVFAEGDQSKDRQVQRPRVFYRREAESSPLVVARP